MWVIRAFSWILLGAFLAIPVAESSEIIEDFYTDRSLSSFSESDARLTEHVDPFTGHFFAEFQSIRIPGAGGLDITLRHFYAHHQNGNGEQPQMSVGGVGWNFHFGRILTKRDDLCISVPDSPEKYPVIETPDGKRQILYPATENSFDYITTSRWKVECIPSSGGFIAYSPDGIHYKMDRKNTDGVHGWYTTSIKDRNNNELTVQYTGSASQFRITQVQGSGSRKLNFSYAGTNGGVLRLSSVTVSNRTWKFDYEEFANARGNYYLKEIDPPSGYNWKFEYIDSNNAQTKGNFSLSKVTTPDGGTIAYTYDRVQFDPSFLLYTTVVKTRKTNDLQGNVGSWSYEYDPAGDAFSAPSCNSNLYDKTTVSTPKGTEYYYHYGASMATAGCIWRTGLLKSKQIGSYKEQYLWERQLVADRINGRPQRPDKQDQKTYAPVLTKKTITLDGTTYTTDYSNHDTYGNPGVVEESGTGSRKTTLSYFINTNKWIVNQVEDEEIDGIGTIDRTLNTAGNLTSISKYGLLTEYEYYPNGNIKKRINGRGYETTYSHYYRGVPKKEEHPEGITITRSVNYFGNTRFEVDGRGNMTRYTHDLIDRLTKIDYPVYTDRIITWATRKKTEKRGGLYQRITNFDGFGREVSVTESGSSPSVVVSTQYNSTGDVTFRSYPGSTGGDSFIHDQIGRITKVTHADGTSKTYEYLSGNQVKVKNERGHTTTYAYRSFGDPIGERYLTSIAAPEGMVTNIGRNDIGRMTSVTQNGKTRSYSYFDNHTLKSITDPETGTTAFERDGMGNMTSRRVGGSSKTIFTYDGLDRLSYINYPPGTPDVDFDHDKVGNLISVSNGVAHWQYSYDDLNQLETETLDVYEIPFAVRYGYNSLGHLNSIRYPSGRTIAYGADALGRPTKASPYLTSVSYWASGPKKKLQFSNGRITETELNSRRWISSLVTTGRGTGGDVDLDFSYDGMGNVDITDNEDSTRSIANIYDGVDRLVGSSSSGNWGSGSASYSPDSDILTYKLGDETYTYDYNNQNRLSLVKRNRENYLSFAYDTYGNVVSDGVHVYDFNDAGDLVSIDNHITNEYDGNRNRVVRTKDGKTTFFFYTLSGSLLGEYDDSGQWLRENIYLDNELVAEAENVAGEPENQCDLSLIRINCDLQGTQVPDQTVGGRKVLLCEHSNILVASQNSFTVSSGGMACFYAPEVKLQSGFRVRKGGRLTIGDSLGQF